MIITKVKMNMLITVMRRDLLVFIRELSKLTAQF